MPTINANSTCRLMIRFFGGGGEVKVSRGEQGVG